MVAIVSGLRAGLELGSRAVLGQAGVTGNASEGRNGQSVFVNVSTGALVIQNQDDYLAARGADQSVLRTYNSSGALADDNGDQWRADQLALKLVGPVNASGSTLYRYDRDGSAAAFAYDSSRGLYVSGEGAGAFDTIASIAGGDQFEYRDGTTGVSERYEASGAFRILSREDTSGNTLTYTYSASGLLASVSTASGETVFYDYTGNNLAQVRTVTSGATATRVRYGYDANNRLETVTVDLTPADNSIDDGKTYQTRYTYDGTSTRVASITQGDGTSLAIVYVDIGGGNYKVAAIRDAINQTTNFAYGDGYATVTDALGLTTRYEFDASKQLTRIVAPPVAGASATRQFSYAANGDVLSVTDGEGRIVVFEYDGQGNQVLQRDQAGNTVTRTFDSRNQLLAEAVYLLPDPDGAGVAQPASPQTTRYVYDATGYRLRFVVSAEGNVTEHRYNGFGERAATITYASGLYPVSGLAPQAALAEADLAAWRATQNLGATQRADFAYDARGQLQTRTTYANVSATTGDGIADAGRSIAQFVYDQAGRLLQAISPGNGSTTYTYDGLDRVLTSTDPLGRTTVTAYDDAARKTAVTLVGGRVTTQSFDAAGRLFSVSESSTAGVALGETKYFYDVANRLRMTQDPTGVRSWILYQDNGLKLADIDGNGTFTEYVYDRSERLVSTVQRGNAVSTAALVDVAGNPVLSVDLAMIRPATSPADQTSWREYDAAGRLVRVAEQVGTDGRAAVTETRYDGASRVVQVMRYANTIPTDGSTGSPVAGGVPSPAASAQDRSTRNFYDADGRLAGTLDAEGYLTVLKYTPAGQLSERIAYANATDAALRASGTLAQLQPAANSGGDIREVTLYDAKGQVTAQIDGMGYLTENVYDVNGLVARSIKYVTRIGLPVSPSTTVAAIRPAAPQQDHVTTRAYDLLGRLLQETNPEGTVTNHTYDAAGNLVSTEKALGTTEVRTLLARYDVQGRLVAELSAEGASKLTGGQTQAQVDAIWMQYGTSHTYDAAGRRTSSTDPAGQRRLFFYDADGALTHRVNALGEVEETRYDARGRAVERIAYGTPVSLAGLAGGLVPSTLTTALAAIADATRDSRTTFAYTRDGQFASTTDAVGTVASSTFNAFGDEIGRKLTDVETNLLETYTVDRRGLRTKTAADEAQINAVATAVYDAFGRVTRSVDANGYETVRTYDRLGRVVTLLAPLFSKRVSTFDAFSRVLTSTDEAGNITRYVYDKSARTMKVTTPEGIVTTTTYNRHGEVQGVTDGKGQTTTYVYDANGRLRTTTAPTGATTTNVHDSSGRLMEAWDANGKKVAYTYDAASRVLTRTLDPGGLDLKTTYGYDAKGQRVVITDPNQGVTAIEYDLKGRVWRQTVDPAGLKLQTVYSYDGRDNTLTVTTPSGTVTRYAYDALGRRKQETVDPGKLNLVRAWAYDRKGNVTSSTDANGQVTRYVYDGRDRRVYTVNALGEVRQEAYDAVGRLVRATSFVKRIAPGALGASPTAPQVQALVIADPADRVEHSVYDKDGRLAATVNGVGDVSRYTRDANGNVISRVSYANRIDLVTWVRGTLPAVVADDARDQRVTSLYDALNRVSYTVDGTRAVVSYRYDNNGNVVERRAYAKTLPPEVALAESAILAALPALANADVDAVERNTYDAGNRLVTTTDGTGAVRKRIYSGENLAQVIAYWTTLPANGDAAAMPTTGRDRVTSYAYDRASRLTFRIDPTNAVVEQVRDGEGRVVRELAYSAPILSLPDMKAATAEAAVRGLLKPDSAQDRSMRHAFDAAGREVLFIGAEGAAVESVYDGAGNVVKRTAYATPVKVSELPSITSIDSLLPFVKADLAADRSTRYAYDAAGRRAYEVDALNRVSRNRYDGAGRLLETRRFEQELAPGVAATMTALDALLESATDRWEKHAHDAAGNCTSTTDALNYTESWTYDGNGNQLTFVNKKGATWTYVRDAAGRLVKETSPEVDLTNSAFDGSTLTLTTTPSPGARIDTTMRYDALGNLLERVEASGRPEQRSTVYEYDAAGRQTRVRFPPVGVYDATADDFTKYELGVHPRFDTLKSLETRTYYDTFGNAVANRDVGGALTQKAYDLAGRVVYEIDALGYVTGYGYNAFGDALTLTRYASRTTLASRSVSTASQAVAKSEVAALLGGATFSHAGDRTVTSTYDRLGRLVETIQPEQFVFDATLPTQGFLAAARTRNTYNAFGDLVQVGKVRNNTGASWYATTHYFDQLGQEKAVVDAAGFLTTREYDRFGNLAKVKEYATALPAASWTLASYGNAPAAVDEDRTTTFTYDALNQKTKETRVRVQYSTAANGSSAWGDLTTTYAYDFVGNQTQVVDATGQATWTYYDALGRIQAVATPFSGATKSLTVFRRDAYGNEIARVEYATPATPTATAPIEPARVDADRQTITRFDALGRVLEVQDANGNLAFSSYDAYGNLAKSWRGVTGGDNQTRTRFEVNVYDAVGHLVETRTPASTTLVQGGVKATYTPDPNPLMTSSPIDYRMLLEWSDIVDVQGGTVRVEVDYLTLAMEGYDAEGGLKTQDAHIATATKDLSASAAAGGAEVTWHVATDKVTCIRIYQLSGTTWLTKWSGSLANASGSGVNVLSQAEAGLVYSTQQFNAFGEITRRGTRGEPEYFEYDTAGRLWRTNSGDGVDKIRLYDLQGNVTSEIRSSGSGGFNQDIKNYSNAQLAASDANTRRVDTTYDALGHVTGRTEAIRPQTQGSVLVQRQLVTHAFQSATPVGDLVSVETWLGTNQVTLGWNDLSILGSGDLMVTIEYKTPSVQHGGGFNDELFMFEPVTYTGGVTRTYQTALLNGDAYARGGTFSWAETATSPDDGGIGQVTRVRVQKRNVEKGWTVVLDQAPGYGANELIVGAPADPALVLVLQTRPVGASTWSSVPASTLPDFGLSHRYDATGLGIGNFEYRAVVVDPRLDPLMDANKGRLVASGTVSISMPPLAAITTPLTFNRSMGDYRVEKAGVLNWAHQGISTGQVLRYRPAGSSQAWGSLAVQVFASGTRDGVDCSVLAAGTYEFELLWSTGGQGVPTHHATGTFSVVAGQPSYYVPPSGTPNITGLYLTLYDTSTEFSSLLRPPPPDVMLSWDACNANLARAYNGSTWVTLAIENYDQESLVFSGAYSGQQHAWLQSLGLGTWYIELYATNTLHPKLATATYTATSTGARTLTVTTPPYTPGYWTQEVPTTYSFSVTTPTASAAVSTIEGATLTQAPGQYTGNRWFRPVVKQNTDRWGNVVSITDPRSEKWVTTYRYNANNQMIKQVQPQASDLGAPVTEIYFDALGRQVAVRDANGNVNGQAFDAAGNLVQELHADTGVVTYTYDALGRRTRTVDAEGHAVGFRHDAMGNLLEVDKGPLPVYSNVGNDVQALSFTVSVKDTWKYDQLGQRISSTNGNGETLTYTYDLRGNIVETKQPMGKTTRSAFDAQGRKIGEVDANLFVSYWTYDYFGQLTDHTDLGGARYAYTHDNARQLIRQTNTRNQDLQYGYDAAGQLTQITDAALGQVSTYMYDEAGRRIRERVMQKGLAYQDNHLAYDAIGNLRRVSDARADIQMKYDRVGNRIFVGSYVGYAGVGGATQEQSVEKFFLHDKMNRQTVVDAYDANGTIGPDRGHVITYDRNGNRKTDTAWRETVRPTSGLSPISDFRSDGTAIQETSYAYEKGKFRSVEEYRYDAANRLWSVVKDGVQVDHRRYDAADRLLSSGPASLPPNYRAVVQAGLAQGKSDGLEQTRNRYDRNGRLLHQDVFNSDGSLKVQVSWDPNETGMGLIAPGYDEVGNVKGYVVRDAKSNTATRYETTKFKRFEGHQAEITRGTSMLMDPGWVTQKFDENGYLTSVDDTTYDANDREFVNDASGRALYVNQGGNVQRQLIVNGEVLGIYGVGVDTKEPRVNNYPNFANLVDFDFGYAPITGAYPNASPGTYIARPGDTLQSIAQSAYGDSALWYRIAEANGVMTSTDLKVGQTLNIPNRVSTIHNNNSTFKPYDPSRITGDLTPNLPMPAKEGCGGAGQLLMVIVAIIVTIYTAGAAAQLLGTVAPGASVFSTGLAALGGGSAAGVTIGAGVASASVASVVGSAIGAAVGSIASQAVGLAVGAIDKFSWKSVGLSAISAGATAGIGATFAAPSAAAANPSIGQVVARAMAGNAITQGIGVAVGLQDRFDWRGVAASGLGAAVGHAVGQALGPQTDAAGNLVRPAMFHELGREAGTALRSTVAGLTAGVTAAAARGGKVAIKQIATDAFGNALGQGLVDAANSPSDGGSFSDDHAARLQQMNPMNLPTRSASSFANPYLKDTYEALVGFMNDDRELPRQVDPDEVLVAGGDKLTGMSGPTTSSSHNYRNGSDIASDATHVRRLIDKANRMPWDKNLTRGDVFATRAELAAALQFTTDTNDRLNIIGALRSAAEAGGKGLLTPQETVGGPGSMEQAITASGLGGSNASVRLGPGAVSGYAGTTNRSAFRPFASADGEEVTSSPVQLRAGQLHEEQRLQQLNMDKNTTVFRPSQAQVQSTTFKAMVGDPELTKGGQYKGIIFDGNDPITGYLEIKGGSSPLNTSYQLRLETYKATIDNKPFTIETTRPVNPDFRQWLQFWGVKVTTPH
ncbi:MAG TPA: LysM peptidoglycan-binding domain-containing protein [Ramlibacter sp.]|uniref:LysM peptidoglycan-binding domain-containing protein n=1 Tax=Ramlibacter sp. TaxID=1917967 RepID=UPI002ED41852